jgi:hypothetical protein
MSKGRSFSFDDDDYDDGSRARKRSSSALWFVIGILGFLVLVVGVSFLSSRRMTQMSLAEAEAEGARAKKGMPAHMGLGKAAMPEAHPGLASPPVELMISRMRVSRLQSIRKDGDWTFSDTEFVLVAGGKPLPADLLKAILGPGESATRIEGKWRIENDNHVLVLSDIRSDGKEIKEEARLEIVPLESVPNVIIGSHEYTYAPR